MKILGIILCFMALLPLPAWAAPPATEVNTQLQYSSDSDGVTSRSMKLTNENAGHFLSYTLYYTRLGQKFRPSIDEYTLLAKWTRPLSAQDTLTFWGGYVHNDLRNFVPGAVMYDKSVSDTQHFWVSVGRESIGTIPANEAGLFRGTASAAYQWKTGPGTYLNLSYDQWFYSDGNREGKWQANFSQKLSSRLDLSTTYKYHDAKFTSPGVYWVPQNEQVLSLAPTYTLPIGRDGSLSFTLQKALWAQNTDGSIDHHEFKVAYKQGNFATGYQYLRDGSYTSRSYTFDFRFFW